jgi:3-methyladenine DNA glycosylase AlkD
MLTTIRAALEPLRDADRAASMAAYMKDHFAFLGVPMPARAAALKPVWASWKPSRLEVLALVRDLWRLPEREYQYAALGALERGWKRLESADLEPLIEMVTTQKPWWDTVDSFASNTVGHMVARDANLLELMDALSSSPNVWARRVAILHQLRYGARTDAERLFRYAILNADHESFWIRKALGWALREYAKRDPGAVLEFFDLHGERFSPLTRREALKHL